MKKASLNERLLDLLHPFAFHANVGIAAVPSSVMPPVHGGFAGRVRFAALPR